MRRFIAGLTLGLLLASAPAIPEWGFSDEQKLATLVAVAKDFTHHFKKYSQERMEVEQWQARSLQRIAWALERAYPAPPERKP